ncbi:hypothetical protein TWF730_011184 [Orbilia blumenaviensis]|uniref:Uncharacterized protein n=1 Tax=Orbilia blumenaviensis TaxID=1796055 RepID=A0AAV9UJY2_9PEZI
MVNFGKSTFVIVSVLNLFAGTLAAPAPVPEPTDYLSLIKTAPGLPTPRELGLTNEDFTKPIPGKTVQVHAMKPHSSSSNRSGKTELAALEVREALNKRYNPVCWPGQRQCDLSDALACYRYLNLLGSQRCVVNPLTDRIRMCGIGTCNWYGRAEIVRNGASSPCADVARGGLWVTSNCRTGARGLVAGSNAAWGNGNLLVDIRGD